MRWNNLEIVIGVIGAFFVVWVGLEIFQDFMDDQLEKSNENLNIFI